MPPQRHFLLRTFSKSWKWKFPSFLILSFIIGLLPTVFFFNEIELNIPKFCEEWFKNIITLSAIFLIVNYLNYQITINRSRDKISMLATNFCLTGEKLFQLMNNNFEKKSNMLNLVVTLEKLIIRMQSEDEFYYITIGLDGFNEESKYFEKLKNYINATKITPTQINILKEEFSNIECYLKDYL